LYERCIFLLRNNSTGNEAMKLQTLHNVDPLGDLPCTVSAVTVHVHPQAGSLCPKRGRTSFEKNRTERAQMSAARELGLEVSVVCTNCTSR
jgi:hypothetical protein